MIEVSALRVPIIFFRILKVGYVGFILLIQASDFGSGRYIWKFLEEK